MSVLCLFPRKLMQGKYQIINTYLVTNRLWWVFYVFALFFSKKIDARKTSNYQYLVTNRFVMRLYQTFINSTTLALKQGLKFKFHCSLHNKKITTYLHTYHKRNKTTWVSYHFHLFLFSISRHLWAVKNRVWKPTTKKCCYDLSCFIEVKRGR